MGVLENLYPFHAYESIALGLFKLGHHIIYWTIPHDWEHLYGCRVEIYMVEIQGVLVPHEPQKSEWREGQKLLQLVLENLCLSFTLHFLPFCEFGVVFVKLTKILCRLFVGIPFCVQCRVGLAGRFAHISLARLHVLSNCAIWLATFHLSGLELVNLTTLYTAYPSTSFTCDRMTGGWGFSSSCLFQEQGLTLSFLLVGLMLVHKP